MKFLTPEGLEKIKKELQERKTAKRQEIARRLEEAKSLGDLAENAEYASAKEEQSFNEGKILELEQMIKESVVLDPAQQRKINNNNTIQIGSIIEACQINSKGAQGQIKTFIIVSSQEAQPDIGKISNESPLGMTLLGHQKDDIIEVETPSGKARYKIIKIR